MSDAELSPIKRALLEQRRLKARIQELERALEHQSAEPVAVIGVGCRFPGASGPGEFWHMLERGVDAITEMPASRWDVASKYDPDPEALGKFATRFGGYVENVDQMDAPRFGISPREAATMDPQQRLLLEVTWEALEHAGLPPDRLADSEMGVFVGIGPNDYAQLFALHGSPTEIDAYLATGNAHSVASGRISYLLGVHGPAISIDTACSSSLVAVQLACESIRAGRCDAAVAGGVGILLGDQNYISLSKARMMAPDGRCKAFDSRADGFVRSEGCGMVVLKRLSDARSHGDRILAVIRGGAINQDGRSNGITAPNGPAQQAVIRAAHENAGTAPSAVTYVEAHGTGTALGDPIEVESLAAVLGEGRDESRPLFLGSVKTNIGHAEAAAGVAGLIKTVLALHHREIPPSLHFRAPNPHIAWAAFPYLRIPTKPTVWDAHDGVRMAGVSAFGFSGTNVHLVVEEAPVVQADARTIERPVHVLALSGKTDAALRAAASDLARYIGETGAPLSDLCYSVNTGRASLSRRTAIVAATKAELRARLEQIVAAPAGEAARTTTSPAAADSRTLFVFPEVDAGDLRAARTLFETQPAFRAAIETCDAYLIAEQLPSVVDALLAPDDGAAAAGRDSLPAAAHVAIRYALATMWKSWGVAPDAVLGAGRARLAAFVVAGALQLEDALALAGGRPASDRAGARTLQLPIFSSATGRRMTLADVTAESLTANRLASPLDSGTIAARDSAAAEGYTSIVDLGTLDWNALAALVRDLYARGVSVDWRGFDRGYVRERVDVPASPWMRERHWFDEVAAPAKRANVEERSWTSASRAAARQAGMVPADVELSRYAELWTELDAFTTHAVARAMAELGLFRVQGERHTVDSALANARVLPVYHHLLSLWMQRLAKAGILERAGDVFTVSGDEGIVASGPGVFGPASGAFPVLRDYLRRCEHQMTSIVTGRRSPLDTLFPDGSFETADFFYRNWGLARYYNGILEAISYALLNRAGGDRPLRVLEIGAGTGGTASTLAPMFSDAGAEYWFTDVSEHFFGRAELAFANLPAMRFRRFDLDESPSAQGIPLGQFDLVVASNAVHATKNVGRALEHARALLAPDGLLLLYEATTHFDWFEMSVALIEGWQHHVDDLRGETPLLSPVAWEGALSERGFDRVAHYPSSTSPAAVLGHHVIVAAAPPTAATAATVATVATVARTVVPAAGMQSQAQSQSQTQSPAQSPSLRDTLAGLTFGERTDLLREVVQRQVKRVMRLRADAPPPDTNDRLMSIGMDSLMAVELRKLLIKELNGAVELPSTLIFDHPTIGAIVALILGSLGLAEQPATVSATRPDVPSNQTTASSIAALSEAEVEAMLLDQLKGLSK